MWTKQGVECLRHKPNSFFSHCQVADAACILKPLHFESPQHLGLLCSDVYTITVYFDDGWKICPLYYTLPIVQNMICTFGAMTDGTIPEQHLNSSSLRVPLPGINMLVQLLCCIGAGSCGICVILATRNIIIPGNYLTSFKWRLPSPVD